MGVSSSLFSSISGLNTMGEAMSVLGDNVANVNTIAFKSSRTTFQDVLSQSVSTASGSAQVGRGVTLSTVDGLFAQGSFESSTTATDLAIGGQGFFMLRASDSAEADMFSRAGEFRFDQEGFLVNPVGNFVQGWTIESETGEIQGTIGDIQIGKSTPPVATDRVEVVVNVDAREINEPTETRLYDSWNGTNIALANPTEPIDVANYEYSTSIKVFDSKGASHDVTIYFDRTTTDNQWEFLVAVNPDEDLRVLQDNELDIYAPYETYSYQDPNQRGAGALMYGVIDFRTDGSIDNLNCWDVPPDGRVDHTLNTNRLNLAATEPYYSFETNFTGDSQNTTVELNFGARYSGLSTQLTQVLVSDLGAYADATAGQFITDETTWDSVFDATGNGFAAGDSFDFAGYDHDGVLVPALPATEITYTIGAGTDKVSDLLDFLNASLLNINASIDSSGRLILTDGDGGPSGLAITTFDVNSVGGANPFGAQINVTTSKTQVISSGRGTTTPTGAIPEIDPDTDWGSVYDTTGTGPVPDLGTFTFSGTNEGGDAITATFTVNIATNPNNNVQDLLDFLDNAFSCVSSIDDAGRLVLTSTEADISGQPASSLGITGIVYGAGAPPVFGAAGFETIQGRGATGRLEDGSRMGDLVQMDFEPEALSSTQYANSSTTIFQDQDGFASGFLQSVSVDTDGIITGNYSNGQVLQRAQVALATFNNLAGLFKEGGNIFSETTESGAPITGAPGTNGLGSIAPNALEQSNVDLGNEFVRLITTQRGFQANSKIITTVDEMLNDLINIKR